MADWYYSRGGQQQGPVSDDTLAAWLRDGHVSGADLVWREGMSGWVAAGTVPELAAHLPGQQPQQPAYGQPQPYGYSQPGVYAQDPTQSPYGTPGYGVPPGAGGHQLGYAGPPQYQHQGYGGFRPEYAGFWLRFVAALVDGIIVLVLTLVPAIPIIMASGALEDEDTMQGMDLLIRVIGTLIGWLYYASQECSSAQATLGKRMLGIKVTDMHGGQISFGRASGRYFGKILSQCLCLAGYIMAAFTEKKQALHDQMAQCLVIKG